MKNRKIIMYIAIVILILFILGVGVIMINNKKIEGNQIIDEYTPVEEITDGQLRQTNIILYFYDSNTGNLATEIRQIDAKKLLENPENLLIEYLIEGPKDNNLLQLIPKNTKLINTELKQGILFINFSEEFINNENIGLEKENKIIESILKTVAQLNEINGIKILINGEENRGFQDNESMFKEIFMIKN